MAPVEKKARLLLYLIRLGEMIACGLPIVIAFHFILPCAFFESLKRLLPFGFLLLVFYFIFAYRRGLFQSTRLMPLSEIAMQILIAYVMAVAMGFLIISLLHIQTATHSSRLLLATAFGCAGLLFYHILIHRTLRHLRRRGYDHKFAMCVGINERTQRIIEVVKRWPETGIEILGAFDTPSRQARFPEAVYLGNLDDVQNFIKQNTVDIVFITLPFRSYYDAIYRLVESCATAGIEVRYELRLIEKGQERSRAITFGDQMFMTHNETSLTAAQMMMKRVFDVLVASFILLLTGPIVIAIGLAIWWSEGWPIFFKQIRVGYHGRQFILYKFRSMVRNAEQVLSQFEQLNETSGPVFKIRNDPRVTKTGKWLRSLSLDELPQIINVIRGDMSLVGPRPPLPGEVIQYEWRWRRRLSVRPGLTCFWQISGRHDIKRFEDWMDLDLKYIDNYSFWLDLKILFMTIPAILSRRGAS